MRTGSDYLAGLRDDRVVWIDGRKVTSVVDDAALAPITKQVAALLDQHSEHPWLRDVYEVPRTSEDLIRLGRISSFYAERTLGMLGRLWDPSASYIAGLYAARDELDPHLADVVTAFYERAKSELRLCNVAFVDPPHGRVLPVKERDTLRVISEDESGMVVSGAKTLCTAAPYSDELMVLTHGYSLRGRTDDQILGFLVEPATKGLTILCRNTLSTSLASLDELDACLVFDEVFIPKDRVLYTSSAPIADKVWKIVVGWDKHAFVRRIVKKFEVLLGLGQKMALALGVVGFKKVEEAMVTIGYHHGVMERLVKSAEQNPEPAPFAPKAVVPDQAGIMLALRYAIEHYPEALRAIELLGGQALILVPTEQDLGSDVGELYDKHLKGPFTDARTRAKLMTLAAEMVGSRLTSRQRLLDYYAVGGKDVVNLQLKPRLPWDESGALIDRFLDE